MALPWDSISYIYIYIFTKNEKCGKHAGVHLEKNEHVHSFQNARKHTG